MKIYRIKAYTKAKRGCFDKQITRFGHVRNYAVRMMSLYYKHFGKNLSAFQLSAHIARKKKKNCKTARMVEGLPSQAVQDCVGRVYKGYRNFFSYCARKKGGNATVRVRPPKCRKASHNSSYTLLQAGYKFNGDRTKVYIQGVWYGFHKSQEIEGKVKRLTIKRDRCGDVWFIVLTDWNESMVQSKTGKAAGYDFGLKTFLTRHDGATIEMPLFFRKNMKKLKALQRKLSGKQKGGRNRSKFRITVAKMHRHIEDCRNDWQWKTARAMVEEFDIICLEDLNLDGMKRLWGRKVSDYGFAEFVLKLEHIASKHGKEIRKVDRWLASSQTCSVCGHKNSGTKNLNVREWVCPQCGTVHDRDINAAKNILKVGTSTYGLDTVRPSIHIEGGVV